jgi:hypothetical protein
MHQVQHADKAGERGQALYSLKDCDRADCAPLRI